MTSVFIPFACENSVSWYFVELSNQFHSGTIGPLSANIMCVPQV